MRYSLLIVVILSLISCPLAQAKERLHKDTKWISTDKVVLQGLDKVSARVFTAEVSTNQKIHFGSLEIYIRSAQRTPPEDLPESICFLEIYDNKPGQNRQQVFSGWMFASNPALSALEHPVYDVWVKEAVVSEEALQQRQREEDALYNKSTNVDEEIIEPVVVGRIETDNSQA